MYLLDFIFDGLKLSNLGCMVGYATSSDSDTVEMGSVVELETVINHGTYRREIVNSDYDDVVTASFDIIRSPCGGGHGEFLTDKEISWFMRWLNRKEYCKFIPIYSDSVSFYKMYYMGTFTEVNAIKMSGNVIGFNLTFEANAPFGFIDLEPTTFTLNAGQTFTLFDESEEIGKIYPDEIVITCNGNGSIELTNSMEPERVTEIKNCTNGEIITMDCVHKIITSSNHNGLYNDFNYVFPRLSNTMRDKKNILENSGITPYSVQITYSPIRKVGIIV